MSTMTLQCWLHHYHQNRKQLYNYDGFLEGERLGQAFCNDFIKASWPELYYQEDYEKAMAMIVEWLVATHNYPLLPHKVDW